MASGSMLLPSTRARRPTATARVGYTVAVLVNVIGLWAVHQLLRWEWPRFLTDDFERVLPFVTASFLAGIVVNVVLVAYAGARLRALTGVVTAAFGFVASLQTWSVFPFDFAGYEYDWAPLVRTVLVIAMAGSGVGATVDLVKVVRPAPPSR